MQRGTVVTEPAETPDPSWTTRDRDLAAEARDAHADASDAAARDRELLVDAVLAAADERDRRAARRDAAAFWRDMDANLQAFIGNVDDTEAYNHRMAAARDRRRAQADRAAARSDRHRLANIRVNASGRVAVADTRVARAVERLEAATADYYASRGQDGNMRSWNDRWDETS